MGCQKFIESHCKNLLGNTLFECSSVLLLGDEKVEKNKGFSLLSDLLPKVLADITLRMLERGKYEKNRKRSDRHFPGKRTPPK